MPAKEKEADFSGVIWTKPIATLEADLHNVRGQFEDIVACIDRAQEVASECNSFADRVALGCPEMEVAIQHLTQRVAAQKLAKMPPPSSGLFSRSEEHRRNSAGATSNVSGAASLKGSRPSSGSHPTSRRSGAGSPELGFAGPVRTATSEEVVRMGSEATSTGAIRSWDVEGAVSDLKRDLSLSGDWLDKISECWNSLQNDPVLTPASVQAPGTTSAGLA